MSSSAVNIDLLIVINFFLCLSNHKRSGFIFFRKVIRLCSEKPKISKNGDSPKSIYLTKYFLFSLFFWFEFYIWFGILALYTWKNQLSTILSMFWWDLGGERRLSIFIEKSRSQFSFYFIGILMERHNCFKNCLFFW